MNAHSGFRTANIEGYVARQAQACPVETHRLAEATRRASTRIGLILWLITCSAPLWGEGIVQPAAKAVDMLTGNMGNALGFKFSLDQNVQLQTYGVLGGSPVVNGSNQGITAGWAASTNLITNGWTAAAAQRLNGGEVFTITGLNAVNPQNRVSTNALQQFVVNGPQSSDGAGNMTLSVSPAIIAGGQFQNVAAYPTSGNALNFVGAASTAYPQNLAFHKNFGTLAMADLPLPGGVDFAKRAEYRGFRIRVIRAYDINGDRMPLRTDVLYGTKALLPEIAVRITG